jgi:hypothetical protein
MLHVRSEDDKTMHARSRTPMFGHQPMRKKTRLCFLQVNCFGDPLSTKYGDC